MVFKIGDQKLQNNFFLSSINIHHLFLLSSFTISFHVLPLSQILAIYIKNLFYSCAFPQLRYRQKSDILLLVNSLDDAIPNFIDQNSNQLQLEK